MKKISFLLSVLFICFGGHCLAVDRDAVANDNTEKVLSWMNLSPKAATQASVTALLGKPASTEENKKRTWWHYNNGTSSLSISWNNKSDVLERFSFTSTPAEKTVFDARISRKLKSGSTDIAQAIKLLGVPHDMTVKAMTQEMHYAYSNSVLRLFFRNRTLVDFTLLTQTAH